MLTANGWDRFPGLVHGFLSCAPSHKPATDEDWRAQLEAHGIPAVTTVVPRQVHGTRVEAVAKTPPLRPEADGLVATTPGIVVGVTTADCVPLLLVAPDARVAAAVHAGWRGALAGIVPGAVTAVAARAKGLRPDHLHVAIGPAIGGCCYEVGPDVRTAFEQRYGAHVVGPAFRTTSPRPYLDLRTLVRRQLEAAGLPPAAIQILGPCTACDRTYASYRRDGAGAGRQLSFVGWI